MNLTLATLSEIGVICIEYGKSEIWNWPIFVTLNKRLAYKNEIYKLDMVMYWTAKYLALFDPDDLQTTFPYTPNTTLVYKNMSHNLLHQMEHNFFGV